MRSTRLRRWRSLPIWRKRLLRIRRPRRTSMRFPARSSEESWSGLSTPKSLRRAPSACRRRRVWPRITFEPINGENDDTSISAPRSKLYRACPASFRQQTIMAAIGASVLSVAPGIGRDRAALSCRPVPAGRLSACRHRHDDCRQRLRLCCADTYGRRRRVLSVEFKINFLAPAVGDRFIARGRVARAGRTITVCTGEVVALAGDAERSIALMQATMMAV